VIEAMRFVLTTALILTVVPVTLHGQARPAIGGAFFGTIIGGTVGFFWRTEK